MGYKDYEDMVLTTNERLVILCFDSVCGLPGCIEIEGLTRIPQKDETINMDDFINEHLTKKEKKYHSKIGDFIYFEDTNNVCGAYFKVTNVDLDIFNYNKIKKTFTEKIFISLEAINNT